MTKPDKHKVAEAEKTLAACVVNRYFGTDRLYVRYTIEDVNELAKSVGLYKPTPQQASKVLEHMARDNHEFRALFESLALQKLKIVKTKEQ